MRFPSSAFPPALGRDPNNARSRAVRYNGDRVTRTHKISNVVGVVLPFVGFVAALVLLWHKLVWWTDLGIAAGMYVATGLGVTVGFHRLLTHRSFDTYRPIRY